MIKMKPFWNLNLVQITLKKPIEIPVVTVVVRATNNKYNP